MRGELMKVHGKSVRIGSTRTWRGLIATFVSELDVKQSSRDLYARSLSRFFLWMEDTDRQMQSMTISDIKDYKNHLEEERLASMTIGSYIIAVRKFYEWIEAHGYGMNIAKGIKSPKRKQAFKKRHLTDEKSAELLEYFQNRSLRDYAIVNLILRTGLRTIEVVRADIGDISFEGGKRVLKVWGKGRMEKDEIVVLSDKAYIPIENYLATRKQAKAGDPLFVSDSRQNKGERLTTRTISGICKEGLKGIKLNSREYTAHSLRHTTAVAIILHGGNIMEVQEVLRHSSPVTSQIYLESIKRDIRLEKAPELRLDEAF